jgi:acetolactate synthase-1/2/3 large subunit
VIAGAGAYGAREALIECVERYQLGLYSSFRRQDVFPNDHPQYLGHLTLGTSPRILEALRAADVVLVLGCRLGEITSQGFTLPDPAAYVVQVDLEPRSMGPGAVPALGIPADVTTTLDALLREPAEALPPRDWSGPHGVYWGESTVPDVPDTGAVHPARVIEALIETAPADAVITNDAGNFSVFLHRYWRFCHPATQVAPTSGAMGYAVPAAVGAKLAAPQRTVIGLVGDGGFLMTGQELETAVRYDAPVVVVAMRNGLYGTIAMHQLRTFGRTAGVDIGEADLAGYAASLGAASFSVAKTADLVPALHEAFAAGRPALVDVAVDPEIITPSATLTSLAGH